MSITSENSIKANEKPLSTDFLYVYAEKADEKKSFVKVSKNVLKLLLGVATKLSELENDKNFIDKTVNDLKNYYLKSESYSKEEIDKKVALIPKFSVQVVDTLPIENIDENTIYLVPSTEDEDILYTEYLNVNGLWKILGTQKAFFSGKASDVTYDDTETKLGAENVQDAIGKLSETVNEIKNDIGEAETLLSAI